MQESSTFFQKTEHSKRTVLKTIIFIIAIAANKLEIQVFYEGNT